MRRWPEHSTPHFLFDLAEKKTGRGRSKRKERHGGSVRAGAYLRPPAGDGWPFLVVVLIKRVPLGETFGPGRARIPFSPLSAGAGLAEPRSPGETVYGFSGGPAMGFSFSGGPGNPLSPGGLVQAVPDKFCHQCADEPPRRHPRNNGGFLQQVIHRLVQPNLNLHALYRNHPLSFFW